MNALLLTLLLAGSGDSLAVQVKAKLSDAAVQQGTFEQTKQVKGFKRPLKSSGTYVVTKGEGVRWNTLKPLPSELSVKAGEISSTQNGKEVFRLDAKTEPTVKMITQLLFSLLAGDLAALESQFSASGEVKADGWHIVLEPKSDGLKKVFSSITIDGDRAVRGVLLKEQSGDTTVIALTPEA